MLMDILKVRPNWWQRSLQVLQAMTCMPSSASIVAMGYTNTSSGACWIRRSIGSYCAPDSMSVYLLTLKACTAARSSQVYGSTQQRSYAVTWRPCSLLSSAGLPVLSTLLLQRGFTHHLRRHKLSTSTTKVYMCNNAKYTPCDAR